MERQISINAPIDEVWKVSAVEFEHIDRWDGNVRASRSSGAALSGGPVGGRVCDLYGGGKTVERFVEFDESRRSFTYDIVEGLPGFIVSAKNIWTHDPVDCDEARLSMRLVMQVKGILGLIMQRPMRLQMGRVLGNAQEELKHYVETGQPHPRKQKKMRTRWHPLRQQPSGPQTKATTPCTFAPQRRPRRRASTQTASPAPSGHHSFRLGQREEGESCYLSEADPAVGPPVFPGHPCQPPSFGIIGSSSTRRRFSACRPGRHSPGRGR
ncbi:MAG: SRPBCC family protein [Geminicoccaceae bacterium]